MKNTELGDLAQCELCQMVMRRHYDDEGTVVDLDLRTAPFQLVAPGLRWWVHGDGAAINPGRAEPAQLPRLLEIRDNLLARIDEAREHGWLGEVDGLTDFGLSG